MSWFVFVLGLVLVSSCVSIHTPTIWYLCREDANALNRLGHTVNPAEYIACQGKRIPSVGWPCVKELLYLLTPCNRSEITSTVVFVQHSVGPITHCFYVCRKLYVCITTVVCRRYSVLEQKSGNWPCAYRSVSPWVWRSCIRYVWNMTRRKYTARLPVL